MNYHALIRPVLLGVVLALPALSLTVMAERHQPLTAYQRQLRTQVDTTTGAPQTGRNPAGQPQTSLAWAASQPVGNGLRTDAPAAAVAGDHQHHVMPAQIIPDPKATGKLSNGCRTGFANPGQTCVTHPSPATQLDDLLKPLRLP
jgi:hypothetical protein